MAPKQVRMRRIALIMNGLGVGALFAFSVVLGSGRGGSWALSSFLAFEAIVSTSALVLLVRAQRVHNPHA